jgi:hypothetical protein
MSSDRAKRLQGSEISQIELSRESLVPDCCSDECGICTDTAFHTTSVHARPNHVKAHGSDACFASGNSICVLKPSALTPLMRWAWITVVSDGWPGGA